MNALNVVVLTGNLVADPELRWTQAGKPACNFRVAVNRNYKGADGKTPTDFINCVMWGGSAENYLAKYGRKGRKITVNGTLQQRSYQAQDGSTRHVYEVQCDDARFLDPNPQQQQQGAPQQGPPQQAPPQNQGYQGQQYPQPNPQPAQPQARSEPWPPPQQQAPQQQPHQETYQTNFEEELPF